ncbi:MAG: iron ABC transporter substrate-binding protein [Micropruina sp.]
MFRRPARLLVPLFLASAMALVGCSAPATPVASSSSASDAKVTVYSGRNETLVRPILDKFTTATGIAVEVRYGETAQMAAQLIEEGDRTQAAVFLAQDAGGLGAVGAAKLFRALPQATLDKVDAQYRDPNGLWVGVTGRSRVLAYNSTLLKAADLPASVFDLVKPEWKGKVGVAPSNASFQSFITAMRVQHGDAKTTEFLTALKANDPQIREKNGVIVADVEAGKFPVGLVNHYYVYELAGETGTTADKLKTKLHFFPGGDTGALVNVSGVGLLAKQPDTDGQALVDYLLGTEAQTYFAEKTFEYPLIAGIASAPGLPKLDELEVPKVSLSNLAELDKSITLIKEAGLL